MFFTPPSRSIPITRFRRAAISCGAEPVLTWLWSSPNTTSRTPVQPVFYSPVSPPYAQQPGGVRPLRRQAGDGVGEFHCLFALVPPGSFHAADLCQSRPVQVAVQGRRCPQPAPFPAVSTVALPGGLGKALPRAAQQRAGSPPPSSQAGCPSGSRSSLRPVPVPSGSVPAGSKGHHRLLPCPPTPIGPAGQRPSPVRSPWHHP